MPYSTTSEVPSYVPKAKRKQWMAVWNSAYKEHGDEARAFAEANAAIKKIAKFGTLLTGFTEGSYGPFECARCKFSEELGDGHICVNPYVADDESVPEDEYGNKVIDGDDCCNFWTPADEEEEET